MRSLEGVYLPAIDAPLLLKSWFETRIRILVPGHTRWNPTLTKFNYIEYFLCRPRPYASKNSRHTWMQWTLYSYSRPQNYF